MRYRIMWALGPWILISIIPRWLGIMVVKPGYEWTTIPDLPVMILFAGALLWPWLRLPFTCKHERVHICRRNASLCESEKYKGKHLWKDVHGVLNFAECDKCGHIFQAGTPACNIYAEKETSKIGDVL